MVWAGPWIGPASLLLETGQRYYYSAPLNPPKSSAELIAVQPPGVFNHFNDVAFTVELL